MKWPDPMITPVAKLLPEGFTLTQLSRLEIASLAGKVLEWYPNIRYGDGARFTRPEYYFTSVSLKFEVVRDSAIYVGRKGNELICMFCVERDYDTKNLYGRMGVVDPRYRRSGLGLVVMELIEYCARHLEMANIFTYASLHDGAIQHLLERSGYLPVGVIPKRDREYIQGRNEIVRVPEVLYIKSLPCNERELTPSIKNMTPAVKRIWQSINSIGNTDD